GAERDAERKPSPVIARCIASQLRREPDRIWLIGDSVVDIQAARGAGIRSAAVTWGFREENVLRAEKPDAILRRPPEITRLVQTPPD
ncbi:MAG: HAD hydrolase-like protein, partial [Phycisphaerae bacterium]